MNVEQEKPEDQNSESLEEKGPTDKDSTHKLKQAEGEIGGPAGLEPTRYGDWERKGIISDF